MALHRAACMPLSPSSPGRMCVSVSTGASGGRRLERPTHPCNSNLCLFVYLLRDEPRKATNVSVLRLPQSAWVHFRGPSDSGGCPIVSYTVHAQPLTADSLDSLGSTSSPRSMVPTSCQIDTATIRCTLSSPTPPYSLTLLCVRRWVVL